MDQYEDALIRRREQILSRMDKALAKSGRSLDAANLMAVSKTVDIPETLAAIHAGYNLFGENRPQEFNRKLQRLQEEEQANNIDLSQVRFDMIGNLQSNKINSLLGHTALIHSVSSFSLAQAISVRACRMMKDTELSNLEDFSNNDFSAGAKQNTSFNYGVMLPQKVLLEVNVSGETSKHGFAVKELEAEYDTLCKLQGIQICGLMCMAPAGRPKEARMAFSGLRELKDHLNSSTHTDNLVELSMGMSEDFEIALEEGSTCIRLGRVVFNPDFALE